MKQSDLCSPSVSVGACEFTACVSVNFMHRHRSARRVVTLLASELKTANDKSWNNRKIIQIWLVSRVLHKQQKFFPAPPACFFPANMESICPSVSMPCSCPGSYAHTRTNIHTDTHTHMKHAQSEMKAGTESAHHCGTGIFWYTVRNLFWKQPLSTAKNNHGGLLDENVNEVCQLLLSSQNNKKWSVGRLCTLVPC